MSNFDAVFGTSVQTAVGSSVSAGKPLVVYIAAAQEEQAAEQTWLHQLLSPELLALVAERAVALRLVKGSQECAMFEQVFPNVQAPCLYIVRVQAVLDVIHGDVTKEQFEERVRRAIETPAQTPTPVPQATPVNPVTPATQTPPAPRQEPKSLKQQSQEVAAKKYREEQLRLKQTQREERERIRRLLKADEEERKALEKMRRMSKPQHDAVNDEEGDAAIKELRDNIRKKDGQTTCALSLRLLDGHSVQHVFNSSDTLTDVRKWLDANRTDGDVPYRFHRTIPRVTYDVIDEEKTLTSLELTPRSALILQPFSSYTDAYGGVSQGGGLLSKVWRGISSFWGGARDQPGHNPAAGAHVASTSASSPHSATLGSGFEPFRDNTELPPQSPQSSYYASPMHSPESRVAIGMSHPSALNLDVSSADPDTLNRPHTPQMMREPSPSLAGAPAPISRMNSNIRTLNSPRPDERLTYNGNQLNLEDDKKRPEQ